MYTPLQVQCCRREFKLKEPFHMVFLTSKFIKYRQIPRFQLVCVNPAFETNFELVGNANNPLATSARNSNKYICYFSDIFG